MVYQKQRVEQPAKTHYENFPVASILLPKKLRAPVRVVYAFARCADDLADEGDLSTAERLAGLQAMADAVVKIDTGLSDGKDLEPVPWLWPGVAWMLNQHRPPAQYLLDLISAFQQDLSVQRYADEEAVADYTRRSADPVGRLVLHLAGRHCDPWLPASDSVCSALQLINFYQDICSDLRTRNRLYLPDDALARHGVDVPFDSQGRFIEDGFDWSSLNPVLTEMTVSAMTMLVAGQRGLRGIGGRLGLELNLICLAGLRVGEKLLSRSEPTLAPRLNWFDRALLLARLGGL